MLVRFKFSNFKCFRDEAVLSMVASKYKSDDKVGNTFKTDYYSLLKSAAVYGANASGKTKLFLRSAWKAWNKESKDISRCIGCKNKHGDNCPNSSLCYSLPYKPFYEKEAQRNDE